MKIKLDENVHGDVQEALASWGHDVTTVHDESLAGRPDAALAEAIRAESRCLVSFFGAAPELPGRLWIVDEVRARDWTD